MEVQPPAQVGPQPVTFVVAPVFLEPDDFSAEDGPSLPTTLEDIAAAYHPVISAILGSPLKSAGMIEAIYVNLSLLGWYRINPQQAGTFDNVTQNTLRHMLVRLDQDGSIVNPTTLQQSWTRVNDIGEVMGNLPPNTHVVGCKSGAVPGVLIGSYIATTLNNHAYVFVVGEFDDGNIQTFVTDNVRLSNHQLTATWSVATIIGELERKWGIN